MKRRVTWFGVAVLLSLGLTSLPGTGRLSPERLDMLDQMGYFTPGFKTAVHDLVNSKHALEQANAEKAKFTQELPDLQNQAMQAEAQAVALRQELAKYEHPDETDFAALQQRMNDPGAKQEEQIALAQAYVWTYPTSPHASDAQQYLQATQKKIADAQQSVRDAEAAQAAAHAKLVQRAQARQLSLSEWRDFLRDMSQDDLVKLLGRPSDQTQDYWTYTGEWIADPATNQKVGMEINFNAGRVISVDEKPSPP